MPLPRHVLAVVLGAVALGAPGAAAAAPVVEDTVGVHTVPRASADPVTEALERVPRPMPEAPAPVEDAVEEHSGRLGRPDAVQDTIDAVLGTPVPDGRRPDSPVPEPPAPGGGGTAVPPPATNPPAPEDPAGAAPRVRDARSSATAGAAPATAAIEAPTAGRGTPAGPLADPAHRRISRAAVDAVQPFAIPLAVVMAVGLFLAVQRRIDARDPKLAGCADTDEMEFA